jgi:hypothetical protein
MGNRKEGDLDRRTFLKRAALFGFSPFINACQDIFGSVESEADRLTRLRQENQKSILPLKDRPLIPVDVFNELDMALLQSPSPLLLRQGAAAKLLFNQTKRPPPPAYQDWVSDEFFPIVITSDNAHASEVAVYAPSNPQRQFRLIDSGQNSAEDIDYLTPLKMGIHLNLPKESRNFDNQFENLDLATQMILLTSLITAGVTFADGLIADNFDLVDPKTNLRLTGKDMSFASISAFMKDLSREGTPANKYFILFSEVVAASQIPLLKAQGTYLQGDPMMQDMERIAQILSLPEHRQAQSMLQTMNNDWVATKNIFPPGDYVNLVYHPLFEPLFEQIKATAPNGKTT